VSDLPLDLDALRRAIAGGRVFRYHLFYGHRREPDGVFSQWWPCAFEVDGQRYATAEQFMMAGKARLFLLATGDGILVEASPTDRIWGIGFALVRARALLRAGPRA
jgi:predicted NAD-dependent protein-ADP-ribosyltransferase YbiA (DUF1768 family)